MTSQIFLGNCEEELKNLPDNSIDSVVTDPPYELGFMGKSWDSTGIAYNVEMWREVFRVLKPGGHLLSFGGSRTYHRMACAIEDAGFEIRDQIMWLYGSGFPKSLNVSKAIDKAAGAEREVVGQGKGRTGQAAQPNGSSFSDDNYQWPGDFDITAPATPAAQQWQGWGTALKPAHEPIVMARKPLSEKTVAKNVLQHGTGALNIDGSRVGTEIITNNINDFTNQHGNKFENGESIAKIGESQVVGRWPANVIHDGSDEVVDGFPNTGKSRSALVGSGGVNREEDSFLGPLVDIRSVRGHDDNGGSAARFFYSAKASKKDKNEGLEDFMPRKSDESRKEGNPGGDNPRNRGVNKTQNFHPTVKPTDLMRYLVRMVTPPDGTVLDPFTGSGSTGKAAVLEGFNFIGVEQNPEYIKIAEARIKSAEIK